jgi:hypothetical protein
LFVRSLDAQRSDQTNNLSLYHFPITKSRIADYNQYHRRTGDTKMKLSLSFTEAIRLLGQVPQLERTACLVAFVAWFAERLA